MSQLARISFLGLSVAVGATIFACVSSDREGFASDPSPTTPSTDDGGTGAGGDLSSGGLGNADAAGASTDGCSDDAKLVYVLSLEGDLYSFAPAEKKFTKIGPLDCTSDDGTRLTPISMAVDRHAVAWVNMRPGGFIPGQDALYEVDTKTAKCTPSGVVGSMGGMGFSTNEGSTEDETLFVLGGDGFGSSLMKVDFAKSKLETISDVESEELGELTGTGDGRLYGFLLGEPLGLAAVDKSTTALSKRVELPGIKTPRAPMYAFSFWGGDFYVYTATDTSASKTTTVARYRPSDGSLDTSYMTSIGFHIVGAGVSTCAPTTSPK